VSNPGSIPADFRTRPFDHALAQSYAGRPDRIWLHALLLGLTLFTTTLIGAWLDFDFRSNQPSYTGEDWEAVVRFLRSPALLAGGLPFSLTLLAILLAHELGHYLACVFYRVEASLPYFLPAPTPIGTLGAFIRIRTPIRTLRALFDIGIAGPLAGFALVVPAMAIGIAWSKVIPGIGAHSELVFGRPLLEAGLCALIFPGVAAGDICLHPAARAAWVGALATALNLLPIGQLDGGHILYPFTGRRHRALSMFFVLLLIPLGLRYSLSWILWAVILFFFGLRHPPVFDDQPIGRGRKLLGVLAILIFAACFTVTPLEVITR
jgi:membrane-associated protease RseP (regulator of RpoE activity)